MIPMIGVLGILLLAGVVARAIFAAWERMRSVGMTTLGLVAALVIGIAALAFATFEARGTVWP
ncbi:MAG: hypothetical protein BMS9Abin04_439 [Planctomycetia bacterium]|nr:MAG: hypothetical protein BMS9Abin04_439 [Planctomycetia bacterium]